MERITLNMVPTGVLEICHASQYDIGREIRFDLIDGTDDFVLSGDEDITIFIRDFEGNLIESSAPNTSSNYVVWTSSEGELDVSGPAICELRVTKDDDVLGSANYIMEIEADAYDGAGIRVETVGPADICTFETTLAEPYQSVLVNVLATGGNGTPDNPINGYTEANITRCGVNLFQTTATSKSEAGVDWNVNADGTINVSGTANGYTSLEAGTAKVNNRMGVVTISGIASATNIAWNVVELRDADNNTLYQVTSGGLYSSFTVDLTSYPDVDNIRISLKRNNNSAVSGVIKPQVELGNEVTTYHPYTGNTYTIAFGQTVYGGVLDVTRGKLHVTHGKYTLDNTATAGQFDINTYADRNRISYVPYQSDGKTNGTFKADKLVTAPNAPGGIGTGDYQIFGSTTAPRMWITVPTTIATTADFLTYISSNPIDVVYELAAPFDIDLTPVQISALALPDSNNVFADCGQTTVKYLKEGN